MCIRDRAWTTQNYNGDANTYDNDADWYPGDKYVDIGIAIVILCGPSPYQVVDSLVLEVIKYGLPKLFVSFGNIISPPEDVYKRQYLSFYQKYTFTLQFFRYLCNMITSKPDNMLD